MNAVRVPGWLPPARVEPDPLTSEEVPNIEPPRLLDFEAVAQAHPDVAAEIARRYWESTGTVYRGNPDHSVTAILPTVEEAPDVARDPVDVRPVDVGRPGPGVDRVAGPLRASRRLRGDRPEDDPGTPGPDTPGH